jgi:hypothetical protein
MLLKAHFAWLLAVAALVVSGCATLKLQAPIENTEDPAASVSRLVKPWATPSKPSDWKPYLPPAGETERRIREKSTKLVGLATLRKLTGKFRDDCVGFVEYALARAGIELKRTMRKGENGVTALYREASQRNALHTDTPREGDLVFFRETYDVNRDRRKNDGLTHIGIVETVEADGTVVFLHRSSKGVTRSRMNLQNPSQRADPATGRVLNDFLRRRFGPLRAYLTGELFASFARTAAMVTPDMQPGL